MLDSYGLAAAFAILVAFPISLALDRGVPRWLVLSARWGALVAATSLLLPRGPVAAAVASVWLVVTLAHTGHGLVRFVSSRLHHTPIAWAEASSAVGPVVAAVALVWSRWDGTFAGFGEPLATLTVPHFHFTFGLLPLTLAAFARQDRAARAPLWGVVFAPPLVGLLFALRPSPAVPSLAEACAVGVLALSVAAAALSIRGPGVEGVVARVAGLVLAACTALAAWFSMRLALGQPTLSYDEMLRWHGVGNAVATVTLGMIALRSARFDGVAVAAPAPDLRAATQDVPVDKALFTDDRSFDLGPDRPGRFERVADALLRYTFYPPDVMRHATTFADRPARLGDRIGMVLLVPLLPGYAPISLPATTEVNLAERGEDHASFGYLTTTAHYGKGAWSATVTRAGGQLSLRLQSRMTPLHPLALLGLPIYRWFQQRAHRRGAAHLGRVG